METQQILEPLGFDREQGSWRLKLHPGAAFPPDRHRARLTGLGFLVLRGLLTGQADTWERDTVPNDAD